MNEHDVKSALKTIYIDLGPDSFFGDSNCVFRGLKEMCPDSTKLSNALRLAIDSDVGKLYLPMIYNGGIPNGDFYLNVSEKLSGNGLSKEFIDQIIVLFDNAIGYESGSIYLAHRNEEQRIDNVNSLETEYEINSNYNYTVGSIVSFGYYYEPLTWIIIAMDDKYALLLSEKIIETCLYDYKSNVWTSSYIRNWLNNEFLGISFIYIEKLRITSTNITDRIILLSLIEADSYLSLINKKASATNYCKSRGCTVDQDGCSNWWLRSGDKKGKTALVCDNNGNIVNYNIQMKGIGVRPALWVKIG